LVQKWKERVVVCEESDRNKLDFIAFLDDPQCRCTTLSRRFEFAEFSRRSSQPASQAMKRNYYNHRETDFGPKMEGKGGSM
jgi:hypothetical protein